MWDGVNVNVGMWECGNVGVWDDVNEVNVCKV